MGMDSRLRWSPGSSVGFSVRSDVAARVWHLSEYREEVSGQEHGQRLGSCY